MIHGAAKDYERTAEYTAWSSMKSRCYLPSYHNYNRYGGRGITVCDRWLESFQKFLEDIGEKPSASHSLDRIDNDGNYEPGNCRWATKKEQSNNRGTNKLVTAFGETKSMPEWLADPRCVVNYGQLQGRLFLGTAPEEAITKPVRPKFVPVEAFGESKMIHEWAKDSRCSVTKLGLWSRLKRGIPPEVAISMPAAKNGGNKREKVLSGDPNADS